MTFAGTSPRSWLCISHRSSGRLWSPLFSASGYSSSRLALILNHSSPALKSTFRQAVAIAFYLVAAASEEIWLTTLHSQRYLSIAAFLILLDEPVADRPLRTWVQRARAPGRRSVGTRNRAAGARFPGEVVSRARAGEHRARRSDLCVRGASILCLYSGAFGDFAFRPVGSANLHDDHLDKEHDAAAARVHGNQTVPLGVSSRRQEHGARFSGWAFCSQKSECSGRLLGGFRRGIAF